MDKFFSSLGRGKTITFALACVIVCSALIIGIVAKIQYDIKNTAEIQPTDAGSISALGVGKLGGHESGSTGGEGSLEQSGSVKYQTQEDASDQSSTSGSNLSLDENEEVLKPEENSPSRLESPITPSNEEMPDSDGAGAVEDKASQTPEKSPSNSSNTEGKIVETSRPLVVEFKKISIEGASIELGEIPHYTGTPVEPTVSVRLANGIKISGDTDYTVSYSNNDRGGMATVTVTGIGDYEGIITQDFEVISDIPENSEIPVEQSPTEEPSLPEEETTETQPDTELNSGFAVVVEDAGNAVKVERSQKKLAAVIEEHIEALSAYEDDLNSLLGEDKYNEYLQYINNFLSTTHFAKPDMSVPHMEGSLRVKINEDAALDEINRQLNNLEGIYTNNLTKKDLSFGWFWLRCNNDTDLAALIELLSHVWVFEDAQLDCVYFTDDTDMESMRNTTFSYDNLLVPDESDLVVANTSTSLSPQSDQDQDLDPDTSWEIDAINAKKAWDLVGSSQDVTVAVMDTGCLVDSADLKGNFAGSYNAITKSAGITDVDSKDYHGTHVCGIVSARAYNDFGTAGVSNNAKIYPVCVAAWDESSRIPIITDTTLAEAYSHIIQKRLAGDNIRIINLSCGRPRGAGAQFEFVDSDIEVIEKIAQADASGILTVTAAGNDWLSGSANGRQDMASYLQWPAIANPHGLNVIALEKTTDPATNQDIIMRSSFSNCEYPENNVVTIAAPGSNIASIGKDDRVVVKSGTSQAAPCVSGVAALMFAANSRLDTAQVKDIIEQTAQDIVYNQERTYKWYDPQTAVYNRTTGVENAGIGEDQYTGYGMIDAYQAVLEARRRTSYEESEPATPIADHGTEIVGDNGSDSGKPTSPAKVNVNELQLPLSIVLPGNNGVFTSEYSGTRYTPLSGQFTTLDGKIYKENQDYKLSYSNNINAGTNGSVTITGIGSLTGSRTVNIVITPRNIASLVQGKTTTYYYNAGKNINLNISFAKTPYVPRAGVDYDVFMGYPYVGKGYATINGKGNFTGSYRFEYNIKPRDINIWYGNLTIPNQTYTGKAIAPVGTRSGVVGGVNHTLKPGANVTITYKNNVNAGTATVTITGKGNYCGKVSKTFKILKAKNTLNSGNVSYKIHTKSKKKLSKASTSKAWKSISGTKLKGVGTITYKKVSGSKQLTINSKTGAITTKKGTKRGNYTMKVRISANGNSNYNSANITKTVKVSVVK